MKIERRKLDLILARRCMTMQNLRNGVSPKTLTKIRRGEDILPATLGRISKALGVDPAELLEEE